MTSRPNPIRPVFLFLAALIALAAVAFAADGVAGIEWTAPAGWAAKGESPMRAASYTIPPAAGDSEGGECVVYYFGAGQGGGVEANIKRWNHAVEITACRAGLIVSGDLDIPRKILAAEPQLPGDPSPADKMKELLTYSVSEHFFEVRRALGITIVTG